MIQDSDETLSSDPITELCKQFQQRWGAEDEPPSLRRMLKGAPANQRETCFRRLLMIDVSERQIRDLETDFESYIEDFPEYRGTVEGVLEDIDFRLTRTTQSPAPSDCETRSLRDIEQHRGGDSHIGDSDFIPAQIDRYAVQKTLGSGGYGVVYLARDTRLQRDVALKVLHSQRAESPEDVDNFLEEAQTIAALDHPGIVPIYDFPRVDDCYLVVSKYIEGETLSQRHRRAPLSIAETVRLILGLADTLGFVHQHQVIHRDVKPGNILISTTGKCYLTDFGLALRDNNFGREPGQMGTVFYMSPEQARGEAHLVDASCDLFSLGVVMYELLTGHRPFVAADWPQVMKLICSHDPTPPRQRVPEIPEELQRIVLKMLQKRPCDRYRSTELLIEDLQHFLATEPDLPDVKPNVNGGGNPVSASGSISHSGVGIVPRGLRSFDRDDAIFFRELLPGPTDREGIPDSLRFWKTRLESSESDERFRVGVIYGPSGCGKSSFIKAGLLPLLDKRIAVVLTEAVGENTAARTVARLRSYYADLPEGLDLPQCLAWLRHHRGGHSGRRLLIVIDQFEQWLHTWDGKDDSDMVLAMRQCDGDFLQTILLVRDDFWVPVSHFTEAVGVNLVPSRNLSMVDLFDLRHARKVLAEYGRAFRRLPPPGEDLSRSQELFLDQAINGLSTGDKVIPVQLATFSEIMKGRDWDSRSLRDLGGVEGVGVRFLEESFSSSRTPAEKRIHEKAAQAILQALLPHAETNIRGTTCSRAELQAASGYTGKDRMFEQVIHLLDNDLRLITPAQISDESGSSDDNRHYQLTHDFLVPAVREWIHRRQNRTPTGRAILRLSDRTEVWKTRRDAAHLPSWWEWMSFLLLTRRRHRSVEQQRMLDAANRRHGVITAAVLLIILVAGFGLRRWARSTEATMLVSQLQTSRPAEVSEILDDLTNYSDLADARLTTQANAIPASEKFGLRSRLYLLRVGPRTPQLLDDLMAAAEFLPPEEFALLRRELQRTEGWTETSGELWRHLDDDLSGQHFFRSAMLLSAGDVHGQESQWKKIAADVTDQLLEHILADPRSAVVWYECAEPVAHILRPHLIERMVDRKAPDVQRHVALRLFTDLFEDDPRTVLDGLLAVDSSEVETLRLQYQKHASVGAEVARGVLQHVPDADQEAVSPIRRSTRLTNAAALLLSDSADDQVLHLLKNSRQPETRSKLIEKCVHFQVPPEKLLAVAEHETDAGVFSALLLILGSWEPGTLSTDVAERAAQLAKDSFQNHADSGIHSAAEWMLRRHGYQDWIYEASKTLSHQPRPAGQRWQIVDELGLTLIDVDFRGYSLQISAQEVTYEQFTNVMEDPATRRSSSPRLPMNRLKWFHAVGFCRALTEKLGGEESDQCYPEFSATDLDQLPHQNYLERHGFRLLNRWEFEFADRGDSDQRFSFGDDEELILAYDNSLNVLGSIEECGLRKPTPRGFFNMIGNATEWGNFGPGTPDLSKRPVLGGWHDNTVNKITRQRRTGFYPTETMFDSVGFRIARLKVEAPEQPPRPSEDR